MSEDTTQEVVEPTESLEDQTVSTETEGVEEIVESPQGTDTNLQSPEDDQVAEESLFNTLKTQKGWENEEDLAKAYTELQSEFTRKSQAFKQTQDDLDAIEAVLQGLAIEEPTTTPSYQDPVYSEMRMMKSELDVKAVAERHADFSEVQPIMSEILNQAPRKDVFEGKAGIEILYKMARAEKLDADLLNAKDTAKKELSLKEVEKVRATVADGNKAKKSAPTHFTRDQIANMSVQEYDANRDKILAQEKAGLL